MTAGQDPRERGRAVKAARSAPGGLGLAARPPSGTKAGRMCSDRRRKERRQGKAQGTRRRDLGSWLRPGAALYPRLGLRTGSAKEPAEVDVERRLPEERGADVANPGRSRPGAPGVRSVPQGGGRVPNDETRLSGSAASSLDRRLALARSAGIGALQTSTSSLSPTSPPSTPESPRSRRPATASADPFSPPVIRRPNFPA